MKFGVRKGLGKHLVQSPGWREKGSKSWEILGLAQGIVSYSEASLAPETMLLTMTLDHPLPWKTPFLLTEVYGSIYNILYFVNMQILK